MAGNCKLIPGSQIKANSQEETKLLNVPGGDSEFLDEINAIFDAFSLQAVYTDPFSGRPGSMSQDDKDRLAKNTADLNKYVAEKVKYLNENRGSTETGYIDYEGNLTTDPVVLLPSDGLTSEKILKTSDVGTSGNKNTDTKLTKSKPTKTPFFVNGSDAKTPMEYFYPQLNARLNVSPYITQVETYNFMKDYMYTDNNMSSYLILDNFGSTFRNLDRFYGFGLMINDTALGKFCALAPDIFATYNFAVDVFSDIKDLSSKISNTINKGLSSTAITKLYDNMKERLLSSVDQSVQRIKDQIKSFKSTFVDSTGAWSMDSVMQKIQREKEKLEALTTDDVVGYVKEKLSGIIDYSTNIYENLNIEEMEFLMYRFCEMATQIETVWKHKSDNLVDIFSRTERTAEILNGASNLNTARARAAGAIRFTAAEVSDMRTHQETIPRSYDPTSYLTSYNPGIKYSSPDVGTSTPLGSPRKITAEELDALPTYEEIKSGKSIWFGFTSGAYKAGAAGWNNTQALEKVLLLRLAKKLDRKLFINSAWRSPASNSAAGGSAKSLHLSGRAFDIDGIPSPDFVRAAKSVGWTGFGYYRNRMHIDTGAFRFWKVGYNGPIFHL